MCTEGCVGGFLLFNFRKKKSTCEQGGGGREVGQRERENLRWVEPDAGLDPTTLGS